MSTRFTLASGRFLAATFLLLAASHVQAAVQHIALNYNFNGIAHAGETGTPDAPNGYRSISDRGLNFTAGVPANATLNNYVLVSTAGVLDIVHLGNRNVVGAPFDLTVDGDTVGIQPTWLPNVNQTGPQATTLPDIIRLEANSFAGIVFQISNGGGSFDVRFTFSGGPDHVARLTGPDWFGPNNGQPNIGTFPGVQNNDSAVAGSTLLLTERIVDLSAHAGRGLVAITFENRSAAGAGYAIVAVNVEGTDCGTTDCSGGACCFGDFSCTDVADEAACDALSGYYEGDATECGITACTVGACCTDGACEVTSAALCIAGGGVYTANATSCFEGICAGACCEDGFCTDGLSEATCNGLYFGDTSFCSGLTGPCNDTCAGAQTITDGNPAAFGDNAGATAVDDREATCQTNSNKDVWYEYVASCSGNLTVSTEGTTDVNMDDTVLSVYAGCGGAQLACDDDAGTLDLSLLTFQVTQGQLLVIRVAGFAAHAGFFNLNVNCVDTTGACCNSNLTCTDGQLASVCTAAGGVFSGVGSSCASVVCGGSCCQPNGSCDQTLTTALCTATGGYFQGSGTDCTSSPCVTAACCTNDGATCANLIQPACTAIGGEWHAGEDCGSFSCPTTGACCQLGACSQQAQSVCIAAGGLFQGGGVDCSSVAFCPAATLNHIGLNYNFNGIVHAGEANMPDNPNGYRSISDRGLNFQAGVPSNATLNNYSVVSTPFTLDIVHLGNRNTVAGGGSAFDPTPDADNRGIQPAWLADPNQTGPQTTTLPETQRLEFNSFAGVVFQISNSGGSFNVRFTFTTGPDFVATIAGPDWFGPSNGQPNIGTFLGTANVDIAAASSTLLLTQRIIDLSAHDGRGLRAITFENRTNANAGYAVVAMNVFGADCSVVDCGGGACCFSDFSCSDVANEAACDTAGGFWQGALTECATTACAIGACCTDGACSVTSRALCLAGGGVYNGDGVDCNSVNCGGACCTTDLGCSNTANQAACNSLGGFYQGDATQCGLTTCPVGACCQNASCSVTSSDNCATLGGAYAGDGFDCFPGVCGGACCVDGFCTDGESAATCTGLYFGDTSFCSELTGPCNDTCAGAQAITDGAPAAFADNCGAGAPDSAEASCEANSNRDVWFEYTASCTGRLFIDTEGTTDPNIDDTVLAVYGACGGTQIACDDDSGTGSLSALSFDATQGQTLLIRVAGFNTDCGLFSLNIACVDTGACCNADVSCSDGLTAAACTGAGGVFNGFATTCAGLVCGGACCQSNGTCAQALDEAACTTAGGFYQGDGNACDSETCPTGPCCLGDGDSCTDIIADACDALTGTWFGPGTPGAVTGATIFEFSSQWSPPVGAANNILNGSGLSGVGPIETQTHTNGFPAGGGSQTFWHTCEHGAVPNCGTGTDPAPADVGPDNAFVTIDLHGSYDLETMLVWNFNAVFTGGNETNRSIQQYDLLVAPDGVDASNPANFTAVITDGILTQAGGADEPAQTIAINEAAVRYVRIEADSNYGGIVTGLSEVRFIRAARSCATFTCPTTGACCTPSGCVDTTPSTCGGFVCDIADHLPPTFLGCFGDVDGNGVVNAGDRGFVSANIGLFDDILVCRFDVDGNGVINPGDRGFVSANINRCEPLPDYQDGSGLNHGVPDDRFGGGAGGSFEGLGTSCATIEGCSGSCCLPDGTCAELPAPSCISAGGNHLGEGTNCADNACPIGACCFADTTCEQRTAPFCVAGNGDYQGDATTCATTVCLCVDCDSRATSLLDSLITNVTLPGDTVTINNTSTQDQSVYQDWTALPPADLRIGGTYTVTVTTHNDSFGGCFDKWVKVYIDYNQNCQFEETEVVMSADGTAICPTTNMQSFIVPVGSPTGLTTMRAVTEEATTAEAVTGCGTYTWGETEDYSVSIE